jgi:hypothetical protein
LIVQSGKAKNPVRDLEEWEETMSYYLVRLYNGSGDRSIEEVGKLVMSELAPALKDAGGLQRYIAFQTDDGRLGSASVYDSKEAAQRGLQTARQMVQQASWMKGYQLSSSFGGEIASATDGPAQGQNVTHGLARVYQTNATAAQVADAIAQNGDPAIANIAGRIRTMHVQLDDGRVAMISGFTSEQSRTQFSEATNRHRHRIEAMRAVLPNDPQEEILATVIGSA